MYAIALKKPMSVRAKALASLTAVAAAVALPQIVHWIGGSGLGEILLPMHLPILLLGLLAGPCAGAAAGLLAPFVSFALSGMPTAAMLPFLMTELCIYGLVTGLLSEKPLPTVGKILLAQAAGRAVRAAAIVFSAVCLSGAVSVSVIGTSLVSGIPGILLQLIVLPLFVRLVKNYE